MLIQEKIKESMYLAGFVSGIACQTLIVRHPSIIYPSIHPSNHPTMHTELKANATAAAAVAAVAAGYAFRVIKLLTIGIWCFASYNYAHSYTLVYTGAIS